VLTCCLLLRKRQPCLLGDNNRMLRMTREIGSDIGNRRVQDSPEGCLRIESHMRSEYHIGTALQQMIAHKQAELFFHICRTEQFLFALQKFFSLYGIDASSRKDLRIECPGKRPGINQ